LSASPNVIEIHEGDSDFILAGGCGVTTTITARVKDANGIPVPDQVVTFPATLGRVTPDATTDGAGNAQTEMTPELQAGTALVTAQAGAATKTLSIVVTDLHMRKVLVPVVSR
jgi:hypothetical protein